MDNKIEKPSLESLILETNFQNLVRNIARKFVTRYSRFGSYGMIDVDDLVNEGMIAATTAYINFDPNREVLFSTHAYRYIMHSMDAHCRKFCHVLTISEKESREHLGDLTHTGILRINQEGPNEQEFDIPVGSGVECYYDLEDYFFAGFDSTEKALAKESLLEGRSIRELAQKHNISRSRVGSILQNVKGRLKERAEEYVKED